MEPEPNPGQTPAGQRRKQTMDVLIPLGILAIWIILQIWVLPKAGVPT